MTWTTNKPTVPGWYWWRRPKFKAVVVEVWEQRMDYFVFESVRDQDDYPMAVGSAYDDTEWCGPLTPPGERTT